MKCCPCIGLLGRHRLLLHQQMGLGLVLVLWRNLWDWLSTGFFLLISLADLCSFNDSNGPSSSSSSSSSSDLGVTIGVSCFRVVVLGVIPFFGIAGFCYWAVGSGLGTLGYSSLFPRL